MLEPPCVGEAGIAIYEAQGQPCPRPGLGLLPGNELAWEVMQLCIGEVTRHLVEGQLIDAGCSAEERYRIRGRVARALADPQVTEILYPKALEKPENPAQ